ncbi:MAG: 16S rRNA (uracil(1498)-N(3))-methyltransferase [Gammaproteobacteria bacterium]|nr:16S rRNA (uracil(1498)-N(3))-methyltransferase [Gammaproteobacteria bacterium]
MRIPRIYTNTKLKDKKIVELNIDASNHILRVLRLKLNSPVILFDGTNGEYSAVLDSVQNNKATLAIKEFHNINRESPLKINLAQAVCRGDKMDYLIQKAVELGVNKITPLITEFCNVKLNNERWEKKQQRWQSIAISACEQCRRNVIPRIMQPVNITNFFDHNQKDLGLILDPDAQHSLHQLNIKTDAITIIIGPEGGLSNTELQQAQNHNYQKISLGPRIMRTETAGLAVISSLQTILGDF